MIEPADYAPLVALALAEDLGERGDITSAAVVAADHESQADMVALQPGVLAGLEVARYVFGEVDEAVEWESLAADGDRLADGDVVARVSGRSRSLLAAERTALNLVGRMAGVATATARFVEEVAGTGAKITDTRQTIPGMRALDKYAVRLGGGVNHRFGLYDAVMIKGNHLAAAPSLADAVATAKGEAGPGTMIVVEVGTLTQLEEAVATRADRVVLDNMAIDELRRAVERVGGALATEASGGVVTLENVREIAETGVDFISVGSITHSAPRLDLALDFLPD